MTSPDITSHQIKLALGGLRFDKDLVVGWALSPSIGLVARDIDRMGISISSFKEPLTRSVKEVIIPSIRQNFQAEGRPPWDALADDTIKLRGGSAHPILERTGALRRGATQFNIWSIGDTSAAVKGLPNSVWYGVVHQAGIGGFGQYLTAAKKSLGRRGTPAEIVREAFRIMDVKEGKIHKIRIPQRRFIMYQEDDIDDIQQVFYEWLVEKTIEVGRFSR